MLTHATIVDGVTILAMRMRMSTRLWCTSSGVLSAGGWWKWKPEYVDALSDHLDMMIVGGYYSDASRGNTIKRMGAPNGPCLHPPVLLLTLPNGPCLYPPVL